MLLHAAAAGCFTTRQLKWCARFGMLVPLQAAASAAGCCCRIFLRRSRRRSRWRVAGKKNICWSCKCIKVPDLGSLKHEPGMFRVWFGYDSEPRCCSEIRKLCCLSLFLVPQSAHWDCYLIAAMALPAGPPACLLHHFWCTFSSATLNKSQPTTASRNHPTHQVD